MSVLEYRSPRERAESAYRAAFAMSARRALGDTPESWLGRLQDRARALSVAGQRCRTAVGSAHVILREPSDEALRRMADECDRERAYTDRLVEQVAPEPPARDPAISGTVGETSGRTGSEAGASAPARHEPPPAA